VSQAYTVLSSPRLRQTYDSYGEQGLKMYENCMSFTDGDMGSRLSIGPMSLLVIICSAITLVVTLITAFAILLLLRLNDTIHLELAVTFTPLWLLDGLLILSLGAFMATRSHVLAVAFRLVQLVGFIAFQVLLCVRVDGGAKLAYIVVFSPLLVVEAVMGLSSVLMMPPSRHKEEQDAGNTLLPYPLFLFRKINWLVATAALLLLLALRLDDTISVSWTFVFLPFWLLISIEFTFNCVAANTDSVDERSAVPKQLAYSRLLVMAVCVTILALLCIRLDSGAISWLAIFWPLFLASSLYCCCCCLGCCAISLSPRQEAKDVPPPDGDESSTTNRSRCNDAPMERKAQETTPLIMGKKGCLPGAVPGSDESA
ncbi:MAG: hypothetical protein SGPRY_008860, partial [Prymnesium sp.]